MNLGFWISRFSDFRLSSFFVCQIFLKNMLVRYRGINNKGVLERPWTKWRVLRAISSTLKFQLPSNVEKWTFRCHVRPHPAKVRDNVFVWCMPSPRTPPDLPNFNLNCEKNSFCEKLDFSVFLLFLPLLDPYWHTEGVQK